MGQQTSNALLRQCFNEGVGLFHIQRKPLGLSLFAVEFNYDNNKPDEQLFCLNCRDGRFGNSVFQVKLLGEDIEGEQWTNPKFGIGDCYMQASACSTKSRKYILKRAARRISFIKANSVARKRWKRNTSLLMEIVMPDEGN